jgi:hypothetical protein
MRIGEQSEQLFRALIHELFSSFRHPVQTELGAAMRRFGEFTMKNELLWQRMRTPGPVARRRSST